MAQENNHEVASLNPFARKSDSQAVRLLPAMPFEVVYESQAVSILVHKLGEDTLFRIRSEEPDVTRRKWEPLDVYALRDAFLAVSTEAAALQLLFASGGFRRRDDEEPEDRLLWSDFKHWQTMIRSIMSNGPLPSNVWPYEGKICWIDHITDDEAIRYWATPAGRDVLFGSVHPYELLIGPDEASTETSGSKRRLRAEVPAHSMLQGILATVFLDGLSGIQYRLCSLSDCQTLYEVNSKHERQYCSQPCAHKASVRRRRAEMKAAEVPVKLRARKKTTAKGKG